MNNRSSLGGGGSSMRLQLSQVIGPLGKQFYCYLPYLYHHLIRQKYFRFYSSQTTKNPDHRDNLSSENVSIYQQLPYSVCLYVRT